MNVAEAAREFEQTTLALKDLESRREAAKKVLLTYFERHPDKRDYRGRIGYSEQVQWRLDTAAVRAELGDRVGEFEVSSPRRVLSLLK